MGRCILDSVCLLCLKVISTSKLSRFCTRDQDLIVMVGK